jgi:hypothetical protein
MAGSRVGRLAGIGAALLLVLLSGCATSPAPGVSLYGPCAPNLLNLGVKF